jgi:hypothetical protein
MSVCRRHRRKACSRYHTETHPSTHQVAALCCPRRAPVSMIRQDADTPSLWSSRHRRIRQQMIQRRNYFPWGYREQRRETFPPPSLSLREKHSRWRIVTPEGSIIKNKREFKVLHTASPNNHILMKIHNIRRLWQFKIEGRLKCRTGLP